MAYKENIPQASDIPATSQADLLGNFQAIKQLIDVNHATFSSANKGKHNLLTMPEQAASPATAVNEIALFTRESAFSGQAELCARFENNGAVVEFTSGLAGNNGWTRLPSGFLIKWGVGIANGDSTVTFPVAATIPAFTALYNVQLTVVGAAAGDLDEAVRIKALTPLNFTCYGSKRTTTGAHLVGFTYLAIGI
jgi:hypothetical protein